MRTPLPHTGIYTSRFSRQSLYLYPFTPTGLRIFLSFHAAIFDASTSTDASPLHNIDFKSAGTSLSGLTLLHVIAACLKADG